MHAAWLRGSHRMHQVGPAVRGGSVFPVLCSALSGQLETLHRFVPSRHRKPSCVSWPLPCVTLLHTCSCPGVLLIITPHLAPPGLLGLGAGSGGLRWGRAQVLVLKEQKPLVWPGTAFRPPLPLLGFLTPRSDPSTELVCLVCTT